VIAFTTLKHARHREQPAVGVAEVA
jgi:hypothetical protein